MRKSIVILILSIMSLAAIYAEETRTFESEVSYLATCIKDTVTNKVLTDTFKLRFDGNKALFYNVETFAEDSLKHNDLTAWQKAIGSALTRKQRADKANRPYYILADLQQKTYIFKDRIGTNSFSYTDSLPAFNWQLKSEYKDIAGHRCAKAIGKYMGRTYEAWYATDIPTHVGPWKFYGLPGLVLSVYDVQHQYSFTFIDMQPCHGDIVLFPSKSFKTTKEKFLKEYAVYQNDPIAYYNDHAIIKISFGKAGNDFEKEIKNDNRHRPMEILK